MKIDYGKEGLDLEIDPSWNVTIFHPMEQEVIKNPVQMIMESLENPIGCPQLKNIIKKRKK